MARRAYILTIKYCVIVTGIGKGGQQRWALGLADRIHEWASEKNKREKERGHMDKRGPSRVNWPCSNCDGHSISCRVVAPGLHTSVSFGEHL